MELAQVIFIGGHCGRRVISEPVEGPSLGQVSARFYQLSPGRVWLGRWCDSARVATSASQELRGPVT